ncbi:MAG: PEP-CTERM sorting domain-containing protein, partial [Patescibacteria group bacterium]|nr:PEP-CTERM sorting domain-containing protein [Patescibacteria group bacterium]
TNTSYLPTFTASVAGLGNASALSFVGGGTGDVLLRQNDLGISGNADRTVVTVWQSTAYTGQNYQHTFHLGNQTTNEAYGHSTARTAGAGTAIGNHYYGAGFDSTATAVLGQARVAVSSWDGDGGTGTNGRDWWWVDGAASGSSDRAALATGTEQLRIGSRLNGGNSGNEGFTGYLAEVLVFDTVLTAAERNALGHYIQTKYGITVQDAATYQNVVFDDNFTAANGTVLHGKMPVIGGAAWSQTAGTNVAIQNGIIDTTGGARQIVGTFTTALDANCPPLTLTFEATKLSSTDGFSGISLLEGGVEKLFVGNARNNAYWTMASTADGAIEGTSMFSSDIAIGAGTAVFTYDFHTGFSTLSINGGTSITGTLPAGAAIDSLRIWNNHGGDIAISSIRVTIPEPSAVMLAALGLLLLAGRRRRC